MPEQVLRDAEDASVDDSRKSSDSDGAVDEARSAEGKKYHSYQDYLDSTNGEKDNFRSSVTGRGSNDKKSKKGKFSLKGGGLKKKGPLIAVIVALAAIVLGILVAQGVMPFAVANRLIEEYNTNGISSVLRADNVIDVQMSALPGTPFALGKHQLEALKDNDILPIEYGEGTLLAYQKSSGVWKVAHGTTPSDPSVGAVKAKLISTYSGYSFNDVSLITIRDAYEDGDFKTPYTTASKTWRGGNSGWYDELTELAETVHGFERSRWFNFNVKNVAGSIKRGVKSVTKSLIKAAAKAKTKSTDSVEFTQTKTESGEIDADPAKSTSSLANGLNIAAKFVSAASTATDITCAIVEGFIGVQTVISTYQRLQKLNLASGFLEAVQGVQAGGLSGEPMHEYSNNMTEDDENGDNAMKASFMGGLFSGTPVDADDEGAKSVNTENALSAVSNSQDGAIMKMFSEAVASAKNLLTAFKVCNYVKGGLAVVNMVITILSVIPVFGQILKGFQLSFKAAVKAVIKAVISAAAPIIARELISYMGRKLLQDMATEWLGKILGHALGSAGNETLSANHQTGGGSPGSPAKVAAFRREQQRVIAEEAEYQRSIRSPFDITSGHTFLGSMIYSLIPLATSSGGIGSIIKNVSSTMTNSISKILPTASAIAETNMVGIAKPGDCPIIENMEVKGAVVSIQADIYCNPIYISDQDTGGSDVELEDVVEQELAWGYIEKDSSGNIKVKSNTNLSNYIMYCGQRTSSWGLADANIASSISSSASLGVLANIPILDDISALSEAATSLTNLPWTTGAACVASEANEYWCENQVHQRFAEDQRLMDDEGLVNKNPVTAFLQDYYAENPIDESFEGTLARFSGMTKDDVIATLELMEGMDYIADYKPEERYTFGHDDPETDLQFEQVEEVHIALEPKYIVYNTLRNRAVLV